MKEQPRIRINMLGGFHIMRDGNSVDDIIGKSPKGKSLIQYLILHHGEQVPVPKLIEKLWSSERSTNPENAVKTLVSRLRTLLRQISPNLDACINTKRGGYSWLKQENVTVDLYEFEELCSRVEGVTELTDSIHGDFRRAIRLYAGNLMDEDGGEDWMMGRSVALHNQYLNLVYTYVDLLNKAEAYEQVIGVCRTALDIDAFDEQLHLQLMNALVKTQRNNEALQQYKHVTNLHYRYLGMQPPVGIQEFYKQIIQAGNHLDMNLDAIREELREYGESRGAFLCEYTVFKEIYNLQVRNLKRLGHSVFLGLLMLSPIARDDVTPLELNDVMMELRDVLVKGLRRGDTVCQFSPTQFAVLLPMVNNITSRDVMERMKLNFYQRYPNSSYVLSYRVGSLDVNDDPVT